MFCIRDAMNNVGDLDLFSKCDLGLLIFDNLIAGTAWQTEKQALIIDTTLKKIVCFGRPPNGLDVVWGVTLVQNEGDGLNAWHSALLRLTYERLPNVPANRK